MNRMRRIEVRRYLSLIYTMERSPYQRAVPLLNLAMILVSQPQYEAVANRYESTAPLK